MDSRPRALLPMTKNKVPFERPYTRGRFDTGKEQISYGITEDESWTAGRRISDAYWNPQHIVSLEGL